MGHPEVIRPPHAFVDAVTDNNRYWNQGYSIFSKYDDGIWMTDDSWYEVTHESVAK